MITVAAVLGRVPGLDAATLEIWIAQDWVRPRREAGQAVFEEIDVARVRLIQELRDELALGEPAIPVVLSLLDQLHGARAEMRRIVDAFERAGPEDRARDLLGRLLGNIRGSG